MIKIDANYFNYISIVSYSKTNHEYLADDKVLEDHDLSKYQNTLKTLVFRNNSTYLASNFNYSLTKKRLIMMTKHVQEKLVVANIVVTNAYQSRSTWFIWCRIPH